jgi:hypothetical protein
LYAPIFANSTNCGIIVTCGGSIIVESISTKRISRPGKLIRAKANATIEQANI